MPSKRFVRHVFALHEEPGIDHQGAGQEALQRLHRLREETRGPGHEKLDLALREQSGRGLLLQDDGEARAAREQGLAYRHVRRQRAVGPSHQLGRQ